MMSYPFDQFTALAGANQKLGLALADATRAVAERQFQATTQGLAAITGQDGPDKGMESVTRILLETESNRQAWLAESRAAFDAWQDSVLQAVSVEDAQAYFGKAIDAWTRQVPAATA
jgi:hypothetical protein